MFKIIETCFQKWNYSRKKNNFKTKLASVEAQHKENDTWYPHLDLLIEILRLIDPELLTNDQRVLSDYKLVSGFRNIEHLSNWFTILFLTIETRNPIPFEITELTYHRYEKSLDNFLIRPDNTRSDINELFTVLLAKLEELRHQTKIIDNPIYKDKLVHTINQLSPDLFSIVECFCLIGARDE